jgi:transposase-like protein
MPSIDESRHSSSHGLAIPECPRCHRPVGVSKVKLQELPVSRGIQYWRCQGCSFLWVTIEGRTV